MEQFPSMKDLEFFGEIARTHSLTRTAQVCGVSQPTITYALKRLEAEVGSPLIVRNHSHHGVVLTPSGQLFYDRAISILDEYRKAKREVQVLARRNVRLGLPPIIAASLFPQIARRLQQQHLLDRLMTVEAGSRRLMQLIADHSLDVALLGSIQQIDNPNLDSVELMRSPFTIAMSDMDPLTSHDSVSLRELSTRNFVTLDENFVHETALHSMMQRFRFFPDVILQSNNLELIGGMLRAQLGISFLADIAVHNMAGIVARPIAEQPQPSFHISLVTQQGLRAELLDAICGTIEQTINAARAQVGSGNERCNSMRGDSSCDCDSCGFLPAAHHISRSECMCRQFAGSIHQHVTH